MVQAIENQAAIKGTILAIRPHESLQGYAVVTLSLLQVETLPGKVNLLAQPPGTTLAVTVRSQLLEGASKGWILRCLAKLTPAGAMCEKEPQPGDFTLQPAP